MKKIFTLLLMSVFAISANAITIYVQCDEAPYIWWWSADGGLANSDASAAWPGTFKFDGEWEDPTTGDKFFTYSFPAEVTTVSFLINDGAAEGTKQTGNFDAVTTDRYIILSWDDGEGNVSYQDVSEDYGVEFPDVEINAVGISGNHNGWANEDEAAFKAVEAGKVFTYSADVAALKAAIPAEAEVEGGVETQEWVFKFRPNGLWLGFWDLYYGEDTDPGDGRKPAAEAIEWISYGDQGNFVIDLTTVTSPYITFKLTFAGGKDALRGWSLEAEMSETDGITNVANKAKAGVKYNLAGQRVNNDYRGIVIENGRKYMVK